MQHFDATEIPRLMQCVASKSMPGFTPQPGMDDNRLEGDAAHWLAKQALNGQIAELSQWIDRKAPNGYYIDDDMAEHVERYVERLKKRSGSMHAELPLKSVDRDLQINCRLDHLTDHAGAYNSFRNVYIDDFKYGWRPVEIKGNWTMITYAIAHMETYAPGPETIYHLTIHQPRPYHPDGHVRTWSIAGTDLHAWRSYIYNKLREYSDVLQTGEYCYKCPARSNCPALRTVTGSILDLSDRMLPDVMSNAEMAFELDQITAAQKRLKDRSGALEERLFNSCMNGEAVPNYRIKPTEKPLEWYDYVSKEMLQGLTNQQVSKEKLMTPTQLKKTLGEAVVKSLSHRPPGGKKLQRFNAEKLASEMFGKVKL